MAVGTVKWFNATAIRCNEPEAFGGVEPLHSTYCHLWNSSCSTHIRAGVH